MLVQHQNFSLQLKYPEKYFTQELLYFVIPSTYNYFSVLLLQYKDSVLLQSHKGSDIIKSCTDSATLLCKNSTISGTLKK